jgi:uncharacterized membrane protein
LRFCRSLTIGSQTLRAALVNAAERVKFNLHHNMKEVSNTITILAPAARIFEAWVNPTDLNACIDTIERLSRKNAAQCHLNPF